MSDLKIFTENIEPEALSQIYSLIKQPAFGECKVRIMPDVHAGTGCVIGFTANLGDKVIPNIVGVDIGCGMHVVELGKIDIDFTKLDEVIRNKIPSGKNVHNNVATEFDELKNLYCYNSLRDIDRIKKSIGTLGGGNHFIEIDSDEEGNKYLVIHSGSRNLGKQVAEFYQDMAIKAMSGENELIKLQKNLIADYKKHGKSKDIEKALKELKRIFKPKFMGVPKELCYLEGTNRDAYLHDMQICQRYAIKNRGIMAEIILKSMGWKKLNSFETIHNYIELESNMVRKGAISAKKDELLLIPINMKDGCILGRGKGNDDWNQSAPHGAGRLMSRSKAKENISLEEFEDVMKGIYTTSVSQSTIDESPMAYKPMDEIVKNIKDTVEIIKIIKPVYNFKAGE